MASFDNNLRLTEITPGDEDGTWGGTTNVNWQNVATAFGYGTKEMSADSNETFTIPNGTSDALRAFYLKITSAVSLTATRTVTLAPNTASKVWVIENATTGAQNIVVAQGSGSTVTVPNGGVKFVVATGTGGTADVTDILGSLIINLATQVSGTLPVANGGTGATTYTAGHVLLGAGTSPVSSVAPGALGNVLTSDGSSWTSSAIAAVNVSTGGTGRTSLTSGNVLLGAGTSPINFVAPGTSGNVLTSNGTTWTSAAPTSGGGSVTSVNASGGTTGMSFSGGPITTSGTLTLSGTLAPANGGTGITGLGSNVATWLGNPSSANLAAAVTDESGSGLLVFNNGPTLIAPVLGTPASGNVENCTADGTNPVGFKNIPQNSRSANYTCTITDAGKHIFHPSADTTNRTFTIPSNASVAYPIGTAITFINENGTGGVITIAINSDTLRLAGSTSTGSRTLARNGVATAIKVTNTVWYISGSGIS
jgi:hypothetical protein